MEQASKEEAGKLMKSAVHFTTFSNKLSAPIEAVESHRQQLNPKWWVHFFDSQNDFALNVMNKIKGSATTARIIHDKVVYTVGNGVTFEGPGAKLAELYCKNVNAENHDFQEVFRRISHDYYSLGNAYLGIAKIKIPGTTDKFRYNLIHLDATTILVSKPIDPFNSDTVNGFWQCNDFPNWTQTPKYFYASYPNFQPVRSLGNWKGSQRSLDKAESPLSKDKENAMKQEGDNEYSVIHIKNYFPGYYYYGLPDFYAAYFSGWLNIDYQIPKYNENRFENQFRPSGMLVFVSPTTSEEEAKALNDKIKKDWQGEGQNSKVMVFTVSDPLDAPKYIEFNDAPAGAFETLQALAVQNIIQANNWHPALLIQQKGMHSGGDEIQTAYEMVSNTYINPNRERLLKPFYDVFKTMGFELDDITITTSSPVSYSKQIDPKLVLTINEQREVLGQDADPKLEGKYLFEVVTLTDAPKPITAPAPAPAGK